MANHIISFRLIRFASSNESEFNFQFPNRKNFFPAEKPQKINFFKFLLQILKTIFYFKFTFYYKEFIY